MSIQVSITSPIHHHNIILGIIRNILFHDDLHLDEPKKITVTKLKDLGE